MAQTIHSFGNMEAPGGVDRAVQMEHRRQSQAGMEQGGEGSREHLQKWVMEAVAGSIFELFNDWPSMGTDPSEWPQAGIVPKHSDWCQTWMQVATVFFN